MKCEKTFSILSYPWNVIKTISQQRLCLIGREKIKGQLAIVLQSKKINKGILVFFFF